MIRIIIDSWTSVDRLIYQDHFDNLTTTAVLRQQLLLLLRARGIRSRL